MPLTIHELLIRVTLQARFPLGVNTRFCEQKEKQIGFRRTYLNI